MKFAAVFAVVVAVAAGYPVGQTWTLDELSHAIENPATNPAHIPYLEEALNTLMASIFSGQPQSHITVVLPQLEVSQWTLAELDAALSNPATDPALLPFLEQALNQYMDALFAGQQIASIGVATPVGLIPVVPSPVVVAEPEPVELPAPVPSPVVVPETPASSPLVQIIVNVNQEGQVAAPAPVPIPTPVVVPETPSPVIVVENSPEPVNVVEQAPEDVVVVELPSEPVNVVEVPSEPVLVAEPNPVDIIAVAPPEFNPVDVIAINPPEVNPVDVISPIPVHPVGVVDLGPM